VGVGAGVAVAAAAAAAATALRRRLLRFCVFDSALLARSVSILGGLAMEVTYTSAGGSSSRLRFLSSFFSSSLALLAFFSSRNLFCQQRVSNTFTVVIRDAQSVTKDALTQSRGVGLVPVAGADGCWLRSVIPG
jgi:hypothetical protein